MLTEEEKQRIKDEEFFREEVKASFKKPETIKDKIWNFLNSSVGSFFLTTIVIGSLTFFYSAINRKLDKLSTDKESIRKLDNEIGYRYFQLTQKFDEIEVMHEIDTSETIIRMNFRTELIEKEIITKDSARRELLYLFSKQRQKRTADTIAFESRKASFNNFKLSPNSSKVKSTYFGLYHEYYQKNIISLMSELADLVESHESKDKSTKIRNAQWSLVQSDIFYNTYFLGTDKRLQDEFKKRLGLKRWIEKWPNNTFLDNTE